jgi:ADP-heptose:LPS heptosyltransferase
MICARSPILDLTARLKDLPDVTLYSLQLSKPDQTEVARRAGLVDFTSELMSFDDTAALMCNLDLVIGIDAVISHLAGGLNIPTWVMVDVNPYRGWGAL